MKKYVFAVLIALVLFHPAQGFTETKNIISEGTYNMGDGETPGVAESRALLQAKRTALEQAGTYVESYSKDLENKSDNLFIAEGIWTNEQLTRSGIMGLENKKK